ncbi:tRNA 4-thiouridine(8) synthase ThiI [Actinobacteria bacterium YIM 96077]|uniref:Probable tRNA sulfurtransferase n=1 Tax=Phytoactinopolyspora halophila TaxID=1981511 RepID=A0A329QSL6_9ACTN|nr:tRNA uracil 4-sulfurtransferase ThiI [Phytoactinopolyspora halophila]AYY14933.1 tRNA 4-thiouridine(8) synthase ThiI [Actinobacteria bacterium YIM 96077]RAW15390.1 tRNA 4-thiouridine(8) synthase ThiI [Phytoactinopolyspora halophila]
MTPQRCVLLKYGELVLKGRNRGAFERHLLHNVTHALGGGEDDPRILQRGNVLAVLSRLPHDELIRRLCEVIGISVVQPALRVSKTPDAMISAALQLLHEHIEHTDTTAEPPTFAVRARRRSKKFPLTSDQIAVQLGDRIRREMDWPVRLDAPDIEVNVEVDYREVFVSVERHRGQGGLPVGSTGRALAMLSGGFDSPVAAYRAMRRGLACDFVHFTGAPLTGPSSAYKAYALARELNRFQPNSRVHVVPIGTAQRTLATAGSGQLQIVAQRRLMVRAAATLGHELGAEALVTGDSLGQVSSQTLSNMATVEQASTLPLLRPLVAWDKEEIIAEANRIGTAEISKLPDEDCCTLLTPPRVATSTTEEQLSVVEGRAQIDELVAKVLANTQVMSPADMGESVAPEERAPVAD